MKIHLKKIAIQAKGFAVFLEDKRSDTPLQKSRDNQIAIFRGTESNLTERYKTSIRKVSATGKI
jgi:spore coat polysaccharide biosynthesis protein SpsF (cytidylyltransferase family)